MTPETTQSVTGEPEAAGEANGKSIGWQVLQIAALAALLVVGIYEVDLDAKVLAERRARTAVLLAVEAAAGRNPSALPDPRLERAIEAYAKACGECGTNQRCEEAVYLMQVQRKALAGRGPCKEALFERWNSDETDRGRHGP